MLASIKGSRLLIVDIQDRLFLKTKNYIHVKKTITCLIQATKILNIAHYLFEQAPEKLGHTSSFITNILPNTKPYVKTSFSCAENKKFIQDISQPTNFQKKIILCGIESHICILQTALHMKTMGYSIFCIVDAISSQNEIDHTIAIQRMIKQDIICSTTETIILEWARNSNNPYFKQLTNVLKILHE